MWSVFGEIHDNEICLFVQGWIDNSSQFYLLFLTPIMIAYENRITQEITPTATIITLVLACVSVMDYVITLVVAGIIESWVTVDWARRLLPVVILIVALVLVVPLERAEKRKVKARHTEHFVPVETVNTDNYVTFVRTTRDTGFDSELLTR